MRMVTGMHKFTLLIVGVVVGIVLASSTAAFAQFYWSKSGGTYICEGTKSGVICNETNYKPAYSVAIVRGNIVVSFGRNVIFGCQRGLRPKFNCQYYLQ